MTQADRLALDLDGTRQWTLKLIADIDGDDWSFQPQPGLPHALWLCGHLAFAQHLLIHVRCLGGGVLDEGFADHFPISAPVQSTEEHTFPPVAEVLDVMANVHRQTLAAIKTMSDDFLAEPATGADGTAHPHYTDKRGAVAHCNRHEAFHAGQLATVRRLLGKSFLR